ncbi:uncharacterized protein LOC143295838 isoform X2 [Babylonia areolata]|uniref:uncharacterized protein LOC143295838 isoform X2 n=1 Tax=Babylonia areolata TaxID=304850 RepID=UPI003FD0097A
MAEGRDSLEDNLCWNQEEKCVEEKSIEQKCGYPDLPVSAAHLSMPHGMFSGCPPAPIQPVHKHSRHSETALKELNKAPKLTPAPSSVELNMAEGSKDKSRCSSLKVSNVDQLSLDSAAELSAAAGKAEAAGRAEEGSESGSDSSIVSSYLRATVANPSSLHTSTSTSPPASLFSMDKQRIPTNDLSAPRSAPQPQPQPTPQPTPNPTYPAMVGPGIGSLPGGMMPMLCYSVPFSYSYSGHPLMVNPMFASQPYCPPSNSMGQALQPMMANISCGPQGMGGVVNGATAGSGGMTGGSPLMATLGGYSSQQTLDSRNIQVNGNGPAPLSAETNSGGSRSYSINPGMDTRLTRLREPVLQWIRKQLDRHCRNNWEALASARGWNYEEIRDHLTDCRHSKDSPFLKLLETETFCTYTLQDFIDDMKNIGRKDILMDLGGVLQSNKA